MIESVALICDPYDVEYCLWCIFVRPYDHVFYLLPNSSVEDINKAVYFVADAYPSANIDFYGIRMFSSNIQCDRRFRYFYGDTKPAVLWRPDQFFYVFDTKNHLDADITMLEDALLCRNKFNSGSFVQWRETTERWTELQYYGLYIFYRTLFTQVLKRTKANGLERVDLSSMRNHNRLRISDVDKVQRGMEICWELLGFKKVEK